MPPFSSLFSSIWPKYRQPIWLVTGIIVTLWLGYAIYDALTHEETDDAYVSGHLHYVSSQVSQVVTRVLVEENQEVKAGQVLVQLDPREYEAATALTNASLTKAQKDLERQQPLMALHALAPQEIDATIQSRDSALAQVELAKLNLSYCTIKAPSDGRVGRKNVEVGNRVTAGQTLLVVVEPDVWVEANFKETQLAYMKKDQPATISIDAIPDKIFQGLVESFAPASGNTFALLPADNSTGNFTKIVQRIPVKICFNPDSIQGYEDRIRPGQSVVVKVRTW